MEESIWKYFSLFLLIVLILISILFVFLSYNNSKLQAHSRPAFDYDADFEGEDEEDSEEDSEEEENLDENFTTMKALVEKKKKTEYG